jgi:hypothetical protein
MQTTGPKLDFFKAAVKCHPGASHHSARPLTQHQHLLLLPAWQMGFTAAGTAGPLVAAALHPMLRLGLR